MVWVRKSLFKHTRTCGFPKITGGSERPLSGFSDMPELLKVGQSHKY